MKRLAIVIAILLSLIPVFPATAASLASVSVSPATVTGGAKSTGTVKLGSKAPSGGQVITLTNSDPDAATVPNSVTVKSGKTSATFTITSKPVETGKTLTITATSGSTAKTTKLTVASPKVSSFTINATTLINTRVATGTVKLTGVAPAGGSIVELTADSDAVSIPSTITVPAGSTSKTFTVTAGTPAGSTPVVIRADTGGGSRTAKLTVTPLLITTLSVTTSLTGGNSASGKVTLNGTAPSGGAVISLSTNSPAGIVPATITIKSGSTNASFTMKTAPVSNPTTVTVSALYSGATKTVSSNLLPTALSGFSISPVSNTSGLVSTGKVTLTGPAPTDGAEIAILSSNQEMVDVPETVAIPEGATSATFTIFNNEALSTETSTVTASYRGVTKTVNTTVIPVTLAKISLSPSSTIGGQSQLTGFVTLTGPAPSTGITVLLTSNSGVAVPIESVTVAPGRTTASFGLTTTFVDASTPVVITGAFGSVVKSATLTVNPISINTIRYSSVINSGYTASTTITINGVAPEEGAVLELTSSDPDAFPVPATLTIPKGSSSVTFKTTAGLVTEETKVKLTVSYALSSKSATITVREARLYSIGLNSGAAVGGSSQTGTIVLTSAAPEGGLVVSIESSDATVAQVPATVTVPAGKREYNFTITTTPQKVKKSVKIYGRLGSVKTTSSLGVSPPSLRDVVPNPIAVVAGGSSNATLRLTGPAPEGGLEVVLSSSLIAYVTVPSSITVPAGARSVQFQVSATEIAPLGSTATISAAMLGKSVSATVQVTTLQLKTFTLSPTSIVGGGVTTGTITINGPAPSAGAAIALQTVSSSIDPPVVVTVPKGKTSVTFSIATSPVTSQKNVTVYATFNSTTATADLTLTPLKPTSLTIAPGEIEGGETATGTVTLNGKVPVGSGGITLNVSSDSSAAAVDATVTVAEGANTATFVISGQSVGTSTTATISAVYGGTTVSATVVVAPPTIVSVTLDAATATGGQPRTGTITLSSPAPAGGWQVALSSDKAAAVVPANATIQAGETSRTFTIATTPVSSNQIATIAASKNGSSASALLTVVPPKLINLSLDKSTVLGGNANAVGTVTLDAAAPAGGWSINLTSSNTNAATVPESVTVAAGATSATFQVTSLLVASTVDVTITASKDGATFTQTLNVYSLTIADVTLSQSSVVGGNTLTATVTLNTGAPVGGASITLGSSSGSATMSGTLAFAAGATSKTFTITTSAVASNTTATISASFGPSSKSASLSILAPTPVSVSVDPSSVIGSAQSSTGTVTINGVAPTGGATVTLTKSGSGASVPANVVVAAGQTSATFTITTSLVSSNQSVTINAALNGTTKSTSLTVTPLTVTSVSLDPTAVLGSVANSTGTVTLNAAAPSGGVTVNLASNNTNAATVPSTVVVPQGSTSATFTVTSKVVATNANVSISASYNSTSASATLTVQSFSVTGLTLNPTSVIGGNGNSTATVTIGNPAPTGGLTVNLSSGNTSAATVPATVTIPQNQTSTTFTVTSKTVLTATDVSITASSGTASVSATLSVSPVTINSLSLSQSNITGGTGNVTGTVVLNMAASSTMTVALSSSNASAASVPATVTVNQGQTNATFTITTYAVGAQSDVTITATLNGSKTQTLTIGAIQINSLATSPSSLYGGVSNAYGLVYLQQSAPTGGVVVTLTSSDPDALSVPATVTVPAGWSYVIFSITSGVVAESSNVTITATLSNSKTSTIQIRPVTVQNVSSSPSSLVGGTGSVTGTVYLNTNAPSGGAVVTLSSDHASASVPASVTVPAGSQSANFTVTTSSVSTQGTATVTASYNGSSATTSFTLQTPSVSSVSVSPGSVTGGTAATGTVTISVAAPTEGLTVNLSDNNNAASVPATVTIPAGQTSTTFEISTVGVSSNQTVVVTASFGSSSVNGQLTVNRAALTSLSISPSSVKGGTTVTGTITLSGPAPSGGMQVSLTDNSSKITTQSSVTVPEGETQVSYTSKTSSVNGNTTVTVTASLNGTSKTYDVLLTKN